MIKRFFLFLIAGVSLLSCQNNSSEKSQNDKAEKQEVASKQAQQKAYAAPQLKIKLPASDNTRLSSPQNPERLELTPIREVKVPESSEITQSAGMPAFSQMESQERKAAFQAYLRPLIIAENARLMEQRYLIKQFYAGVKERGQKLSDKDKTWLVNLARKYRSEPRDFPSEAAFSSLLMHVDVIPVELAIAQAANESAWGTSRFAKVGNNLFGQWCFKKGCGIVPARRSAGAKHEVAAFNTVADAVKSYMHNLNSHPAYQRLRVERYSQRQKGQIPSGHEMAIGLQKYSAKGMTYVELIRSMMDNQIQSS